MKEITVIGGGLAGVEAAWQAASAGVKVRLFEMRPVHQTPAHRTDRLAEIVCSNSLKSDEPGTACQPSEMNVDSTTERRFMLGESSASLLGVQVGTRVQR